VTPPLASAADISGPLSAKILQLVQDLLPQGHRDGREWRVGNVYGEPGSSLAVHLVAPKAGVWHDFATGESGDALDLVRAALDVDMRAALAWSRRWLGLEPGAAERPHRPTPERESEPDPIAGAIPGNQRGRSPERWPKPISRIAVSDLMI
jgi:hypothetical protein